MKKNYNELWKNIAKKDDWRNHILPREWERFWEEGRLQAEKLKDFIQDSYTVVEFGCGIGRILKYINAKRRIGIDVCQEFLDKIDDEFIETLKTDGGSINLPDESVDFVYSIMVIQHIHKEDNKKIFDEIHRILKSNRKALIQLPKDTGYYKPSDFTNTYTEQEIKDLVSSFYKCDIKEGNLVCYGDTANPNNNREYFLILEK